ncbi:MAG: prepilin-type N-terminal cleavage/methylation domain-containing protein [Planctomycetes bacterium]|nr:prepilin-type N-terminal cleavage/methylation domain-containing protein [Planctomycetota bacterium]
MKQAVNMGVTSSARCRCAFTLVELLVVVAIIAVVGSAGIGLYAGTSQRLKLKKTARDFLLTAKYARIMAIEKQREYKIQIDNENGGFALATTEWSGASEQFEQTVVNDYYCKPVQFEGAIKFEDIRISPTGAQESDEEEEQAITFSPDGSAQTVVVQIGDGRKHYTISISAATGKAKISFGELDESAEIGTIDLDAE